MKLYLMRHAEAESGERNDPTRGLTDVGRGEVATMGAFLRREVGTVDLVLCSYFQRACDTARGVAQILGCERVEETPWLEPDVKANRAWADVQKRSKAAEHVLIVTHHPLVNKLLELLTGSKTNDVHYGYAHIAHVHHDAEAGQSHLAWFVGPKLVELDTEMAAALKTTAEALGGLLHSSISEAEPQKAKHKKLLVGAFGAWDDEGNGMDPTPVGIGDDLFLQRPSEPAAGMVSPARNGSPFATALQTLAPGKIGEIRSALYEKRWVTDGNACPECDENALAGWIPADEDFPSGDDEPEAHPNCKCTLETRRGEEE